MKLKEFQKDQAQIVVCENNFHGRTTTIISFSNDPVARENFGPFTDGFIKIPYDDTEALENTLKNNSNVAGFLVEPIQGEAGVYVPTEGYLAKAKHCVKLIMCCSLQMKCKQVLLVRGDLLASCGNCDLCSERLFWNSRCEARYFNSWKSIERWRISCVCCVSK